jgi:hypothetical protein
MEFEISAVSALRVPFFSRLGELVKIALGDLPKVYPAAIRPANIPRFRR